MSTPPMEVSKDQSRGVFLAVLVAALGYFVDLYDLILFSVVRKTSLTSLGVPEVELTDVGVWLINMQMGGMLLGGILWGILGDKKGRLSVLFGSILLYSLANIANGLVQDVNTYAALRFIAGVGLAGELGAGITLVSELMSKTSRGYGTTIVAGVGILGAVAAVFVSRMSDWRTAYFIGGGMGLGLLALRVGVRESGMWKGAAADSRVARGNFFTLFSNADRRKRFICLILSGVPIWYTIGILITFSPELGAELGLSPAPNAGTAVLWAYIGLAVGDLGSGFLSQIIRSRKRAVLLSILLCAAGCVAYFSIGGRSLTTFYAICFALGVANGYWAVFVTMASEQFGTNLRATATTSAPNFVRGAVVPLTLAFKALSDSGRLNAAMIVGAVTLLVALASLRGLDETYGKSLDYTES